MQCVALRVNGKRCAASAVNGGDKCSFHRDGVPHKITPELVDQLVALLKAGNYVSTAAQAVGISRPLFYQWLKRGESDAPADAEYVELRKRVEHARAEAEARNVALIANSARENWQAAAWLLERQHPDRWGRASVRMRDEPPDEQPSISDPIDDMFSVVAELLKKRRRRLSA